MKDNIEIENSLNYWNNLYEPIKRNEITMDDWLEKFDDIIDKTSSAIIDLGCGKGNNALYLIQKNRKVISCDQSINAINNIKNNLPEIYQALCFNMLEGLPFDDNYSDIIIADLCLHYFRNDDTFKIINEIKRVLKPSGHLLIRVNSINDINFGAGKGEEIEHHLWRTDDGRLKRFFDEKDIKLFFNNFEIAYMQEKSLDRFFNIEKKIYEIHLLNTR